MAGSPGLAALEAALRAGRIDEALGLIEPAAGAAGAEHFFNLGAGLFRLGRLAEAEHWTRRGLERHGSSAELWNLLGTVFRRTRRLDEALAALTRARALAPANPTPMVNLANVLNDRGDGAGAEALIQPLLTTNPNDSNLLHMLGRARRHQGDLDGAEAALKKLLSINPARLDAWLDRAMLASERQRHAEALAIVEDGLLALPGEPRLAERKAELLIRGGRPAEARLFLDQQLALEPDTGWARYQLARLVSDVDPAAAIAHMRAAVRAAPLELRYRIQLAHELQRAGGLQEAYELLKGVADLPIEHRFTAREVFAKAADFDRVAAQGKFHDLGRYWALNGQYAALLGHLPQVRSHQDRLDLVAHHRLWGGVVERRAGATPILRAPKAPSERRIRLGFLSSDLRDHPVGHFVLPLFEHYDRERFELYGYSFYPGEPDPIARRIAGLATGIRSMPGVSDSDAAQAIAADGVDILIELGGATHMNRVEVMAYRPAPVQASWLGYPHSAGLAAIDHIIVDALNRPPDDLLVETPLVMPRSWVALSPSAFKADPAPAASTASSRNGHVTFGTANNPYKYTRPMAETWARIVAAVPGSRFLFVRPEAGAQAFRDNVSAVFASQGVDPARIEFAAVSGDHLPWYDRMDISLDTFPLTGGTTTCDSLWMGVPVVSLRGESFFERLSHSLLTNAGLADLSVETADAYIAKAVELAADEPRRAMLKTGLRAQLMASPLGDAEGFARDFFALVEGAVTAGA